MYKNILSNTICNSVNLENSAVSSTFEWTNTLKTTEDNGRQQNKKIVTICNNMETITSIRFNKAATKESHAVWFHLYKAQKVAKLIMVLEVKFVVTLMGVVTETVGEGLLRS